VRYNFFFTSTTVHILVRAHILTVRVRVSRLLCMCESDFVLYCIKVTLRLYIPPNNKYSNLHGPPVYYMYIFGYIIKFSTDTQFVHNVNDYATRHAY
jgi:hypothetical protein